MRIELDFWESDQGIKYIIYWDLINGNDLQFAIHNNKLIEIVSEELEKEITLEEFFNKILNLNDPKE